MYDKEAPGSLKNSGCFFLITTVGIFRNSYMKGSLGGAGVPAAVRIRGAWGWLSSGHSPWRRTASRRG